MVQFHVLDQTFQEEEEEEEGGGGGGDPTILACNKIM